MDGLLAIFEFVKKILDLISEFLSKLNPEKESD